MKSKIYILAGLPLLILAIGSLKVSAASGNLYLTPVNTSLTVGQVFSVQIHENSGGDQVNTAQIKLVYPASQLKFVQIDNSPAFAVPAGQDVVGNGAVQLARGALPSSPTQLGPAGDQVIATVEFQVLSGAGGNLNIDFDGPQTVMSVVTQNNVVTGTDGAAYTISSPKSAAAPTPTSTAKPIAQNAASLPAPAAHAFATVPNHDLSANFSVQPTAVVSNTSRWPLILPLVLAGAMLVYHQPRHRQKLLTLHC